MQKLHRHTGKLGPCGHRCQTTEGSSQAPQLLAGQPLCLQPPAALPAWLPSEPALAATALTERLSYYTYSKCSWLYVVSNRSQYVLVYEILTTWE